MAEEMDVFLFSEGKKDAQISDESDETENLENENITRTGDAVKLSRLDGKTSASEGNGTGPSVNGNSIGSSSKKPTGKPTIIEARARMPGMPAQKAWDGWKSIDE